MTQGGAEEHGEGAVSDEGGESLRPEFGRSRETGNSNGLHSMKIYKMALVFQASRPCASQPERGRRDWGEEAAILSRPASSPQRPQSRAHGSASISLARPRLRNAAFWLDAVWPQGV